MKIKSNLELVEKLQRDKTKPIGLLGWLESMQDLWPFLYFEDLSYFYFSVMGSHNDRKSNSIL